MVLTLVSTEVVFNSQLGFLSQWKGHFVLTKQLASTWHVIIWTGFAGLLRVFFNWPWITSLISAASFLPPSRKGSKPGISVWKAYWLFSYMDQSFIQQVPHTESLAALMKLRRLSLLISSARVGGKKVISPKSVVRRTGVVGCLWNHSSRVWRVVWRTSETARASVNSYQRLGLSKYALGCGASFFRTTDTTTRKATKYASMSSRTSCKLVMRAMTAKWSVKPWKRYQLCLR